MDAMDAKRPDAKPSSILLVDDEPHVRSALRRALRGQGFEILEAPSGPEALNLLRARPVDLIIADHLMPLMTGAELLRHARLLRPDTVRIMLTGQADLEAAADAINQGAVYRFILKPWDHLDVVCVVRLALQHLEAQRRDADALAGLRRRPRPSRTFVITEEEAVEASLLAPSAE